MKFWIIHAQEPLPRPSTERSRRLWRTNTIAEMLASRGHSVVRWRSAYSHYEKRPLVDDSVRKDFETVAYQFLQGPAYSHNIGFPRVRHHRQIAAEFSRLAQLNSDNPDLIHVGNVPLELAESVVRFGKERGIPVVVDIRDLWPDIYLDLIPAPLHFLRPIVRQFLHFSYRRVQYTMANATAISGITEPFVDWGVRFSGRTRQPSDRVFHMSYPEPDSNSDEEGMQALRKQLGLSGDEFIVCYFGSIGHQSDFNTLLEAARLLPDDSRIRFIVCGDGPKLASLRRDAAGVRNFILPGWVDSAAIQRLMHIASVGLLPFKDTDNYVLNMPNKFSEYLSGGLALACGVRGVMANLIQTHGCGFTYRNGNAMELAGGLQKLAADPLHTKQLQELSRQLFRNQFNCRVVYEELCSYLESLARSPDLGNPSPR